MLSRRLQIFFSVVDTGSFSKAAKAAYLSPVSVKKQMDALEAAVGVKLFERSNRGVTLTPAGLAFNKEAQNMRTIAARAIEEAKSARRAPETIRIGTSLLRPSQPLTDIWSGIAAEHSSSFSVRIVPFSDDPESFAALTANLGKDIDCFAAPCDSSYWHERHRVLELSSIPLELGVPKTHRLAAKERIAWDDIEHETMMLPQTEGFSIIPRLRADIERDHPGIRIVDTIPHTDVTVFNECAERGYLMASCKLWRDVHPMVKSIPVDWDYELPYGVIYARNPSPAMEYFIRIIEENT